MIHLFFLPFLFARGFVVSRLNLSSWFDVNGFRKSIL